MQRVRRISYSEWIAGRHEARKRLERIEYASPSRIGASGHAILKRRACCASAARPST